jgi:hypothetical protein
VVNDPSAINKFCGLRWTKFSLVQKHFVNVDFTHTGLTTPHDWGRFQPSPAPDAADPGGDPR